MLTLVQELECAHENGLPLFQKGKLLLIGTVIIGLQTQLHPSDTFFFFFFFHACVIHVLFRQGKEHPAATRHLPIQSEAELPEAHRQPPEGLVVFGDRSARARDHLIPRLSHWPQDARGEEGVRERCIFFFF